VGTLLGALTAELLVALVVRGLIGVLLATVLGLLGWAIARMSVPQSAFNSVVFSSVTVLVVGGSAGIGAILAWWNTEAPWRVKLPGIALTMVIAMLSSWIAFQLIQDNTHFTWVPRVGQVKVIYLRDALSATLTGGVLSANLVAGLFYLYRAALRREL
jgi:hypothetical protein